MLAHLMHTPPCNIIKAQLDLICCDESCIGVMSDKPVNKKVFKRLIAPVIVLFVAIVASSFWRDALFQMEWEIIQQSIHIIKHSVEVFTWLAIAWLVVRLIDVIIWNILIEQRTHYKVPRLIKDLVAAFVFFTAFLGIISLVFSQSITGLLAASGALGLVVGLAIKNVISDVFDGVSINIDRPFKIGDYVFLHDRTLNITGKVIETTWRTTRFETPSNSILVVPNSKICAMAVSNLSMNNRANFEAKFCFHENVSTERVLSLLIAAAKSSYGILDTPPPVARVNNITENGIEYLISYWIEPAKIAPGMAKNGLVSQVVYLSRLSNIPFAMSKQEVYMTKLEVKLPTEELDRKEFIQNTKIFENLNDEEVELVTTRSTELSLKAGSIVATYGEQANSMYILIDGLLSVMIPVEDHDELERITYLASGEFFGEMSLLTGEPRSATIMAETNSTVLKIEKNVLTTLFEKRPLLAEKMSALVAERRMQNIQFEEEILNTERLQQETKSISEMILGKMKNFFSVLRPNNDSDGKKMQS